MKIRRRLTWVLSLAAVFGLAVATYAQLGSVLKGGAVVFAVSKFGPDINHFINGLEGKHGVSVLEATKVVPILSIGNGGYVGAAQVSGPLAEVKRVQAVAQIEGNFKGVGIRVRALIPVATKSVTNIRRVNGVGVSAIVDIHL